MPRRSPRATTLAAVALAAGAAACTLNDPAPPDPYPYPSPDAAGPAQGGPDAGPGWTGACTVDADCAAVAAGDLCTRDHECLPPAEVRSVMVRWTIGHAAATTQSCASLGQLQITYTEAATGLSTGFSPLMCTAGQFFVDKWPARYDQAAVGGYQGATLWQGSGALPSGNADLTVDLEP